MIYERKTRGGRRAQLTGLVFGRLTVLGPDVLGNSGMRWRCLCTCGERTVVDGCNLRKGTTRSCGCLNSEMTRARNDARRAAKLQKENAT